MSTLISQAFSIWKHCDLFFLEEIFKSVENDEHVKIQWSISLNENPHSFINVNHWIKLFIADWPFGKVQLSLRIYGNTFMLKLLRDVFIEASKMVQFDIENPIQWYLRRYGRKHTFQIVYILLYISLVTKHITNYWPEKRAHPNKLHYLFCNRYTMLCSIGYFTHFEF